MSTNPFSLEGKTILITGASSGIGRQCAISCSLAGASLVLLGRNKKRLKETADLLAPSSSCKTYCFDLTEEEAVNSFIRSINSSFITLDGVIHAAGVSTTLPLRFSSFDKQETILKTNVMGPINLTKELIKKKGALVDGSSVIFIASIMATVGEIGKTLYSISKGALVAGVKSMALELAPRIIRVNSISPGVVKSPMSTSSVYSKDDESLARIEKLHPLGVGDVSDVANACVYLSSDASKWVTGSNLIIDGGYTAR